MWIPPIRLPIVAAELCDPYGVGFLGGLQRARIMAPRWGVREGVIQRIETASCKIISRGIQSANTQPQRGGILLTPRCPQ